MQLLDRIRGLNTELLNILEKVLSENEDLIINAQKQQLSIGLKSDNTLMPQYSVRTIIKRRSQGRPVKGERIALFDYGDFWKGIISEASGGILKITSTDDKTQMLIDKYSENIFGLSDMSIKWLRERLTEKISEEVIKYLKS